MPDHLPVPRRRFLDRIRRAAPEKRSPPPAAPPPSPLALRFLRFVLMVFFRLFRSSGAWKDAVAIATADPRVRRALGDPVSTGVWVGGKIQVSGERGQAAFVVPLHGSRADASLRVQASKARGVWSFQRLEAQVRGGPCIDLLEAPRAGSLPPATPRLPGPRAR